MTLRTIDATITRAHTDGLTVRFPALADVALSQPCVIRSGHVVWYESVSDAAGTVEALTRAGWICTPPLGPLGTTYTLTTPEPP